MLGDVNNFFFLLKVCWQRPVMFCFTPQANFLAHLNFHWRWRWWDQIRLPFKIFSTLSICLFHLIGKVRQMLSFESNLFLFLLLIWSLYIFDWPLSSFFQADLKFRYSKFTQNLTPLQMRWMTSQNQSKHYWFSCLLAFYEMFSNNFKDISWNSKNDEIQNTSQWL